MRLKTVDALEGHLVKSAPEHRSAVYLLLLEDAFERRYYAEKIYRFLRREREELVWERGREALQHLFAAPHRLIWIDPCDEMSLLLQELSYLDAGTKVIVGAPTIEKGLRHDWEEMAVILDLLEEKPWERKQRFQEEISKQLRREKKSMHPEALTLLLDTSSSFAFLKNEVEKILCYVGDKREISLHDVKAIACREGDDSLWEIAEALVLGKDSKAPSCKEISTFLNLLWQIRYYVGLALQWKVENLAPKELKGTRLERFRKKVETTPVDHFLHWQRLLFHLETRAKTGTRDPRHLWEELLIGIASLA